MKLLAYEMHTIFPGKYSMQEVETLELISHNAMQ